LQFLTGTVGDAALGQIVRGHFHGDLVTGKNADIVFPHFARDMGGNYMSILQFDAKHGIGQGLDNGTLKFYVVFFCHMKQYNPLMPKNANCA